MIDSPFSTTKLASRRDYKAQMIRKLVEAGKLPYFRIGQKLIRIPAAAVERYEWDNLQATKPPSKDSGDSDGTGENSSSSGTEQTDENPLESRLVRMTEGLPKLALVKSGKPSTNLNRVD